MCNNGNAIVFLVCQTSGFFSQDEIKILHTGIPQLMHFLWQAENRVRQNSCYVSHSRAKKIVKKILTMLIFYIIKPH